MSIDNCIAELNEHADLLRNAATELCKYQRFKADYENRLKADMVAMLTEIQLEIEEEAWKQGCASSNDREDEAYKIYYFIQQKIDTLKAESEDKE